MLILSFCVYIAKHVQSNQNKKLAYLFNIHKKTWGMKLIFLPADQHEGFLQVDSLTLGCA